jgi:ATP-dependent exoDNAse (exonuclease V) beta subunit
MEADLIVSTIHKAKGMEYSSVTLANDIKKPEEILDAYKKTEQTYDDYKWFEEELNLIYVAVTRAINRVL